MKTKILLSICSMLLLPMAHAQEKELNPQLFPIVQSLTEKFEKYIPENNLEGIVQLYTLDAHYLPENKGFFIGREAIRKEWEATLKYEITMFEMESHSVEGTEDLIYETGLGASTILVNGEEKRFQFKYLNVWEKQNNGAYQLRIDVYNQYKPS